MHNDTMTADPAATMTCPRCEGSGRIKFTRPGGWLSERCTPCSGQGTVDPETARTLALLVANGTAALGDVDGPCCEPHEDPCTSCHAFDLVPDDEPYIPSEAEEADYRAWCRERNERIWADRIAASEPASRTFLETIYDVANDLCEDPNPHKVFIGEWVAKHLAEQVRFFEAKSPEQFLDRRDACLDVSEARAMMRAR